MNRPEDVVIVLAEDDPGHARLIEKHLSAVLKDKIVKFGNGQQALDYLRREEQASQRHLLVLDLSMPVMGGHQLLLRLKADPRTLLIPVIVLTTTDDPGEISRCYELGCNACLVKSPDADEFAETIHRLGLFLTVLRMPQETIVSGPTAGAPSPIGIAGSKPRG